MAPISILVVEDEAIVARDIERQIEALGYRSAGIAPRAEEALAAVESGRPRLVLMDIHLEGGGDGVDAAIEIRRRFGVPCIFLTAYATDEVVERAVAADPLGYLLKPFDEHSLRTAIEVALHTDEIDGKLRRSEARYRAVVESAADAIITTDRDGRVVDWSTPAARLFQFDESEIVGQPFAALFASEGRSPLEEVRPQRLWDALGRRRDGSEFRAEVSLSEWAASDDRFFTAIVRDVSERERSAAAMRLRVAALEAAANAIVITDRTGAIEWVNEAFTRLTGYSREEAGGRNPRDLLKSGCHDVTFYRSMWETILAGNVWQGEIVNRRKDGSQYHEEQTITPVVDSTGAITHFVAVKLDMTDRKRLEEQFLQAQKMEVLGRLAGGVAHDFNNLLTVINGTAEMLLLDSTADQRPSKADVTQVLQAGERAANLTRQLLAFSRKQVLAPAQVHLETQVASLASMIRRLIGEDISLVVDMAPSLHSIRVDPGQFEQILLNLAVNARDAMPNGGYLTVQASNVTVDEAMAASVFDLLPGPYVVLAVTDTGSGMAEEVRTRIFEPFFTTKESGRGTGLGLATVYGIVRQSGGAIGVESQPGRGASFRIYFPSAGPAPTGAADVRLPVAQGRETVLLVEDEDDVRTLAVRMLTSAGYTVLASRDAAHAVALLGEHDGPIDLLLTDVVMPGMSGPDLADYVQRSNPGVAVLFASGYTDHPQLGHGLLSDTTHFVSKPYNIASLTEKVRSVLDSRTPLRPAQT